MKLTCLDVYETASHFYIIGTDAARIRFSVLKLDRNSQLTFTVGEPNHEYTEKDIKELLATISSSSVVAPGRGSKSTINALCQTSKNSFGIIGAVRFLEGFHLLLVTKAKAVALLGHHDIYKIEEVQSLYIPSNGGPISQEEQRYAKLFQSVDLTTNFYFSYTYDLSRTLQENALAQRKLSHNKNSYHRQIDAEKKFIWNDYLLKPFKDNLITDKWTIDIVHGYVGQQIIELPCSKLALILIGRRSSFYAGTRFLKRGVNFNGDVANDVETEQILWDMHSTPSLLTGKFTAFVQRRGSIPLFWSHDLVNRSVVGKPMVIVDLVEPNALTTAAHFKDLRRKYGYPVSVVNLVKRRGGKTTQDEKLLHDQFLKTVHYLNQFMKPGKCIDYISFDVARCNKKGQVLQRLESIGLKLILRQGWFQSFKPLRVIEFEKNPVFDVVRSTPSSDGEMLLQSGISRTNCVDCLDRTNVAQFGLGKVALGFQLYAMGFTSDLIISPQGEVCRVFEDMFDEHGDTMAWQYAGSQLVHSIKTYKKTAAFQERSRDVIQTISRYYSNTFNDYEKQNGINLFLGLFRPFAHARPHLWDLFTDRYLHFPIKIEQKSDFLEWVDNVNSESEGEEDDDWQDWFEEFPEDRAIYGFDKEKRSLDAKSAIARSFLPTSETMYWRYHREFEITNFEQWLREIQIQTNKKVISVSDINQNAFQTTSFMKLFKSPEPENKKSPSPSLEDDDDDDDEDRAQDGSDDELLFDEDLNPPHLSSRQGSNSPTQGNRRSVSPELNVNTGLKAPEEVFGYCPENPNGADMIKYERYAAIAQRERELLDDWESAIEQRPRSPDRAKLKLGPIHDFTSSIFTVDSALETEILGVTKDSLAIYRQYVGLKDNFCFK